MAARQHTSRFAISFNLIRPLFVFVYLFPVFSLFCSFFFFLLSLYKLFFPSLSLILFLLQFSHFQLIFCFCIVSNLFVNFENFRAPFLKSVKYFSFTTPNGIRIRIHFRMLFSNFVVAFELLLVT